MESCITALSIAPRTGTFRRNLHTLWAIAFALIVYRTTALGMFGAISLGLLMAALMVWVGYAVTHRRGGGS